MKQKVQTFIAAILLLTMTMTMSGCSGINQSKPPTNPETTQTNEITTEQSTNQIPIEEPSMDKETTETENNQLTENNVIKPTADSFNRNTINLTSKVTELENGLSAVQFEGEDGFEDFLAEGGASSDQEVVKFLSSRLLADFNILDSLFGCSTIAVSSSNGDRLFGRNFDWQTCNALIVSSKPEQGYSSISTVNLNFISQGGGLTGKILQIEDIQTRAALYAPLDGMNEAGLAVSVNMIQDSATIDQSTDKPDITTTTAIRLLLNKAANVEEALTLLEQYDMHASMGMMIHFALADTTGRSVVVEYVNNEMNVIETPVVTNFYLAEGEKYGIGTAQSHQRYDLLMQALSAQETMEMDDVRDALDSVSKDNFGEFESTEWSIVYNLNQGIADYYHRENYTKRYTFKLK